MSRNEQVHSNEGQVALAQLPDNCPYCHKKIRPLPLIGYVHELELDVFFSCPSEECLKSFIGYYSFNFQKTAKQFSGRVSQGKLLYNKFSNHIHEISSAFENLYNQSFIAEQQELTEICGVGYRKALEFLIKDYAIKNNPEQKDSIEKMQLSRVIETFVSDINIKKVAKRAVWIGNDETHYVRKWDGKNLKDLKNLINLTIHWIEMEILTITFEDEMPD